MPLAQRSVALSLARWLEPRGASTAEKPAEPSALEAKCEKLHDAGDSSGLAAALKPLVLQKLASAKGADATNAFSIYLELLVHWGLLVKQAEGIAADVAAAKLAPELTCTLLLSLYMLVQHHGPLALRFALLRTLVQSCAAAGSLEKVLGPVDGRIARVECWVSDWSLSAEQQQELWALIFDTHAADGPVVYEAALKYVALHEGAELSKTPALRDRLVQSLLLTVRSPDLFRCDELAKATVVQQLEKESEYAPLCKLVGIMARETYGTYASFAAEGPAKTFMAKHDIPTAACADKMRLLTLISLARSEATLSYAAIADALKVDVSEVESWVMQAIGRGLLTAKMDQMHSRVTVTMCAERDFGASAWQALHGNLVGWRSSIGSMLDVVQKSSAAA